MRLNSQLIGILAAVYLLSCVYVVRANEQAVVRRFGRVVAARVLPGPHYRLRCPIDRMDGLNVRAQKVVSVGFDLPDALLGRRPARAQAEVLAGDQNVAK